MSEHVVLVTYTKEIVRLAARTYWWKSVGSNGIVYLVLLVGLFVGWLYLDMPQWFIGFIGALVVVWAGFLIWSYFRIRSFSEVRYREMNEKVGTFYFSDYGIRTEADSGKMELAWRLINEVIEHPQFWLLSVVESTYFTLPIEGISLETQQFILERVRSVKNRSNVEDLTVSKEN